MISHSLGRIQASRHSLLLPFSLQIRTTDNLLDVICLSSTLSFISLPSTTLFSHHTSSSRCTLLPPSPSTLLSSGSSNHALPLSCSLLSFSHIFYPIFRFMDAHYHYKVRALATHNTSTQLPASPLRSVTGTSFLSFPPFFYTHLHTHRFLHISRSSFSSFSTPPPLNLCLFPHSSHSSLLISIPFVLFSFSLWLVHRLSSFLSFPLWSSFFLASTLPYAKYL